MFLVSGCANNANNLIHLFLSVLAFVKLEALRLPTSKNHFALKTLLPLNAIKLALKNLSKLKSLPTLLNKAA